LKHPGLAFLLSFIIPGAGLWYVGKPGWGLINLLVVMFGGIGLLFMFPAEIIENYFHYLALFCAAGSGGVAHSVALRQTKSHSELKESH